MFLYCVPDSCLLCYPTPICKKCRTGLNETPGQGVKYFGRQIEYPCQRDDEIHLNYLKERILTYGLSRAGLHLARPGSLAPLAPLAFSAPKAGSRCREAPGGSSMLWRRLYFEKPTRMPCLMDKWCSWLVTLSRNRSSTVRKFSTRPSTLKEFDEN